MTYQTELLTQIGEAVNRRANQICTTLVEAAAIPSEVPPGNTYPSIVEHFRAPFEELGFETRIETVPEDIVEAKIKRFRPTIVGPRSNLVASLPASSKPLAAFYCHLDTVPVGDRHDWSFDPLAPFVKDQYVWGRGTADSKGGVTAILWAFQILHELGITPLVSPVIALTTDEEIGPYSGLMYLTDIGAFRGCNWFYSADGLASSIGCGSPGSTLWKVRIAGRSVHSGSSFLGINPIEHALSLLRALVEAKPGIAARVSTLPLSPEVAAESGRTHITALLNVTSARTADVQTLVPPEFILAGDRLYIPQETLQEVTSELQRIVETARSADPLLQCTLETDPFYEPFSQDMTHPWLKDVQNLVSGVHGKEVPLAALGGPTDVAYAANRLEIPVVIHGLIRYRDSRNHAPDERCRVDDLLNLTKVIAGLAAGGSD
jgi:acetylornithine deacetylase/succinyl-diaminopimelate desuccinylase-like protein